jgi:hypothetical protein
MEMLEEIMAVAVAGGHLVVMILLGVVVLVPLV